MKQNYLRPFILLFILSALLTTLTAANQVPSSPTNLNPTAPQALPLSDIMRDTFESGSLYDWDHDGSGSINLVGGSGYNGSTGLAVSVSSGQNYLDQSRITQIEQGYLTFWFNPNNISIPDKASVSPPAKAIKIAQIRGGDDWHTMVGLRVRQQSNGQYKAFLEWQNQTDSYTDYKNGEFDLSNGWQKITIGFKANNWIGVWLNDTLQRQVNGITHSSTVGETINIGKTNTTSKISPSGTMLYDEVAFQIYKYAHLWVDTVNGNNANDGTTAATALKTITQATRMAGPSTIVHILPGIYRETIQPVLSGSTEEPTTYLAEEGPGTVKIRGSEPSSSLTWNRLTSNSIGLPRGVKYHNIYYADLSAWGLTKAPRFITQIDNNGNILTRLPVAREPDWKVETEWKHHEYWWAADGGSSIATCNPSTDADSDCDVSSRSSLQLTDRTTDSEPSNIEAGNLTTLGNLTGATLVAMSTKQGHYSYRRTITAHDVTAGRITVDEATDKEGEPGFGWGSKYYVEGAPYLIDHPGEWWYDTNSKQLYLWPPTHGNPANLNLEISFRENGFILNNHSNLIIDGLTFELLEENAIYQYNKYHQKAYNNIIRNATLQYANRGVWLQQDIQSDAPADRVTSGFILENSEIAYMDTHAFRYFYSWDGGTDPNNFSRAGIINTTIRGNEMHHLGFRSDRDGPAGAKFQFADTLSFENNHIHHVAHNGIQFYYSVIQSTKEYGFNPSEIKTGYILIKDNIFEKACQLTADCGALKLWGDPPDNHVYRDVLITGNIFRNTYGWTYVSEKRGNWSGGPNSNVKGLGGMGLYLDMISGVHVYRNIAYNNGSVGFQLGARWRDGDTVYYNNIAANSLYGFRLLAKGYDTHDSVNTQIINNIILNNEGFGIGMNDEDGQYNNINIEHNLYHNNGWRSYDEGGLWEAGAMVIFRGSVSNQYYPLLSDIQAGTTWETNGLDNNPYLANYNLTDHNYYDGSWPDFRLTGYSTSIIDQGTTQLPTSLANLLQIFGVDDTQEGTAFEIGPYEGVFKLIATPALQRIDPGETAHYNLNINPPDLPITVTLTVANPFAELLDIVNPSQININNPAATLELTHLISQSNTGGTYDIVITGTNGSVSESATVRLIVGGASIYLPVVLK